MPGWPMEERGPPPSRASGRPRRRTVATPAPAPGPVTGGPLGALGPATRSSPSCCCGSCWSPRSWPTSRPRARRVRHDRRHRRRRPARDRRLPDRCRLRRERAATPTRDKAPGQEILVIPALRRGHGGGAEAAIGPRVSENMSLWWIDPVVLGAAVARADRPDGRGHPAPRPAAERPRRWPAWASAPMLLPFSSTPRRPRDGRLRAGTRRGACSMRVTATPATGPPGARWRPVPWSVSASPSSTRWPWSRR